MGQCVIDHQDRAIALIIIPASIVGKQNGRRERCRRFFFDQTGRCQVSADRISFQVDGRGNVMGGKMRGTTHLNPAIIGRRTNPDRLTINE